MSRDQFVADARAAMFDPGFDFNLAPLAARGRELGALTPAEQTGMEQLCLLPGWLRTELGLDGQMPLASAYDDVLAIAGSPKVVPKPVPVAGWLPDHFDITTGNSPDVRMISGGQAQVFAANFVGAVVQPDGVVGPISAVDNLWGWQLASDRPPVPLPGRTMLAVVEGSTIFIHWLLDTLPRFKVLEMMGQDVHDFDHLLVVTAHAKFQKRSLRIAGLPREKIATRQQHGLRFAVDEYVHVTKPRNHCFADRWVYEYVTDLFGSPRAAAPHRRLYISRGGAARRKVVNEDELLPVLAKHDVEVIRGEDLGLRGTARLFQEASHVVAPHGAGLANLCFMRSGGKVFEFFGPHLSMDYWRMSAELGLEYTVMQVQGPGGQVLDRETVAQMGFFDRNFCDLVVDVAQFEAALDDFFG